MASSGKNTIWSRNFICMLFANCFLVLSFNSVNTLVSTYATYLGAGPKLMGLLTGMFFGVALAMRPVAGPIATRIDNRKLMMLSYGAGCVANLGYAMFHSIPMFFAFRVLNGLEYAFVGSLGMTIAADSIPQEKMSSGLGIYGASGAVATSIAPQIAIWLRDWGTSLRDLDLGYTFVFLFAAVMLALGIIACALMQPDHKDKAVVAATGKWYQNIISKYALIPGLLIMLIVISYSLFNGYMVPYGEENGIKDIGLFFTVLAIVMLGSRPLCGKLSDRFGAKVVFAPASILYILCFVALGYAHRLGLVIVAAVLAALGYGALNPTIQSICMQMEPKARRAVASNTLYVGMDIGFFVGPLIGGFIKDFSTYRAVMVFGAVPIAIGMAVFFLTWKLCARRLDVLSAAEESQTE